MLGGSAVSDNCAMSKNIFCIKFILKKSIYRNQNIFHQVELLWESLLNAGLSIVIKDKSKNFQVIGACLNFDARSEEAAPLCAVSAFSRNNVETEKPKIIDEIIEEVPMSVVEFLDAIGNTVFAESQDPITITTYFQHF